MYYKKITIKFKNWVASLWQSDTILWYIFAQAFSYWRQEIKDIFNEFKNYNPPFLISNFFLFQDNSIYINKPFIANSNIQKQENKCDNEELDNTIKKKQIKSIWYINFLKLESFYDDSYNFLNEEVRNNKEVSIQKYLNFNVSIPRFNSWDTNIYNITRYLSDYVFFIKWENLEKIEIFTKFIKEIFWNIWFWAKRSIWLWHISSINIENINEDEKHTFSFINQVKDQKWEILVLNHYKPSLEDLENIDFENSRISINYKNTKTLEEINNNFFKWDMNFIEPWSIIKVKDKTKILKWDYYKSWNSYNFWFIF